MTSGGSAGAILLILLGVVALGLLFTGNLDRLVSWLGGNRTPAEGIGATPPSSGSGGPSSVTTPTPTPSQPPVPHGAEVPR